MSGWPVRAGAVALLLGILATAAWGQAAPPSITVRGVADRDLMPDAAQVSVGVEAERATPNAATAEVARAAQSVAEAIKSDGIDEKDVRTATVTLAPLFADEEGQGTGKQRMPRTYRASTGFVLTVRPPERAGLVLSHLVDKGATSIEGIAFTSAEEQRTRDALRAEAMRDARHKAESYVAALDLHLAGVLEITPEEAGNAPAPAFMRAGKSILAAPTPPIPVVPGPLPLREAVSVRWAIAP